MSKYAGDSVTLKWDPAGGTAYTTVGQIRDMGGPSMERTAIDVTTRDSTGWWNEFIKGFKDGGEITAGLVFDPDLASHGTTSTGLMSDFATDSTTIPQFRMEFPGTTNSIVWKGFVTGMELDAPHDDYLAGDVTIKLTGKPQFAM